MEKQRTYNLPQWRKLSSEEHRQPPAQRGERRQNTVARAKRGAGKKASVGSEPPSASAKATASVGRAGTRSKKLAQFPDLPVLEPDDETTSHGDDDTLGPSTPKDSGSETHPVSNDVDLNSDPKSGGGQPKSISARRKYNRKADAGIINEDDFVGFDYRLSEEEAARFNPERCEWLESKYWQQLTYSSAMYGADQPGSLFADSTTEWNVAHLPNVLDVLGQKIPGVNTAYLYVGMWRSTFAWHLEDVDLYSINYIHFGAPKQWYSISQKDLRRFEAVMKSTWPNEAKHCSQFLRHKTFLISPDILEKKHGISVNRLVHNQGEFVITFPYGYHSGYNLGYNCAESVNFATEAWLDFGSKAQKCMCVDDSVWVDSEFIRRRLNGEPDTEEDTDHFEDDEYDEDDADRASASKLPTPPESVEGKSRTGRKRKRVAEEKKPSAKKLCLTLKRPRAEPCVLCPNDPSHEPLLPTDTKQNAHRICGLYTHETAVYTTAGSSRTAKEAIVGIKSIDKDRLKLKCNFCRVVKGACFQCSVTKCTKAFHATCAAAAGVLVEVAPVPYFGADGVEYQDMGCHFRCKVHRPKRPKHFEISSLESEDHLYTYCRALKPNDTVQALFGTENRDIFAGVVKANNHSEESLVISPLPQRTNRYVMAHPQHWRRDA